METPLERRIRTYAFNHGCGLDEATYRVIKEVSSEISMNTKQEGLYDRYFGPGSTEDARS